MSILHLNEAQDFDFLKNSINLDEFKINCTLYSIDIKDAVKKLNIFEKNGKFCIALDHFYWFDANGNETNAPKEVGGNFYCSGCASLTSLEGAPQEVGGDFYCNVCASLTSLEGSPQEVGRDFSCSRCTSLASLKGAPQRVSGSFICSYCTSLTSLEGAPQKVGKSFYYQYCTSLTSLEGAPQEVGESFYCQYCTSLTSLEGAPQEVGESFYCARCTSLTSLEGAPRKIGVGLVLQNTKLTSSQIQSYLDWLKMNPKENYHEPKQRIIKKGMTMRESSYEIKQYEEPYSLEQIKQNYDEKTYQQLANDPVHRWRAQTGIELIHKEPTYDELQRIWSNWNLMPDELKQKSDEKSIEQFGVDNETHYYQLQDEYDEFEKDVVDQGEVDFWRDTQRIFY